MGQESLRLAAGVRPRASGGHRLNSPRPAHQPPPHPGTSTMHASSRSSAGLPVRGFHRTNPLNPTRTAKATTRSCLPSARSATSPARARVSRPRQGSYVFVCCGRGTPPLPLPVLEYGILRLHESRAPCSGEERTRGKASRFREPVHAHQMFFLASSFGGSRSL